MLAFDGSYPAYDVEGGSDFARRILKVLPSNQSPM